MPREQFDEIQIHLADDRSNAAVLQRVDVPTGLSDWLLTSCNSGFGGQAAIFGKDAVNRIPIETTLLERKRRSPESRGRSFNQVRRRKPHPYTGARASERAVG